MSNSLQYDHVPPLAFADVNEAASPFAPWIHTRSGKAVDLLQVQPEDIDIKDIAYALSHLCRYTGHTCKFYSVAHHSLLCSQIIENDEGDPTLCLCALLHDASEAYLGDVAAPLKELVGEPYRKLEKRMARVIAIRFGLPQPFDINIDHVDHVTAFNLEWLAFMAPDSLTDEAGQLRWEATMSPAYFREEFLKRFYDLMEKSGRTKLSKPL